MVFTKRILIFACFFMINPYSLHASAKHGKQENQTKKNVKQSNNKSRVENDNDDKLLDTILNDPKHINAIKTTIKMSDKELNDYHRLINILNSTSIDNTTIDKQLVHEAKQIINRMKNKHVINIQNDEGSSIFMRAVVAGNMDICKSFLKNNVNYDLPDLEGFTPLMHAVLANNQSMVKLLLEAGAQPNLQENKGYSSLALAVIQANSDLIVKMLLDHNADPNVFHKNGFSSLFIATQENKELAVRHLLTHHAHPNVANKNGNTALIMAALKKNISIFKILLDHNADHNISNKNGFTPLMVAAENGCEYMVKKLLALNVNPNSLNIYGETALIRAAENGCESVVKLLLEAGADPLIKSSSQINALNIAKKNNHTITAQIIRENLASKLEHKNKMITLNAYYQLLNNHVNNRRKDVVMHSEKQARDVLIEEEKNSLLNITNAESQNITIDWNSYWTDNDEQKFLDQYKFKR